MLFRSLADLKRAIADGSVAVLTGIPGIGRKTAERIIIELKEKIALDEKTIDSTWLHATGGSSSSADDAVQALVELGYRKPAARDAVQKVLKGPEGTKLSLSDLIRGALKQI